MKKRYEVDGFKVAAIVAITLSLITLTAIIITDNVSVRNIYNVFYFTFFNFTVLIMNWLFFTKRKTFLNRNLRNMLRKGFIVVYSLIYLWATFSFVTTSQIVTIQTVLFLSIMQPMSTVIVAVSIIVLATLEIIFLLNKKVPLKKMEPKKRKTAKMILLISLGLLIITIFVNFFFLQIEEPLILNEEALIPYKMDAITSQDRVVNVNYNPSEKPNVIWIMLESVSSNRVNYFGYDKRDVSPNIDKLLSESIAFSDAYTMSTHSDYAQPGVLSSRYLFANDYRNLFRYDNPRKFVWDVFKEDGYHTGYFSSQDDRWENMKDYYDFSNLDNYSYSMTDGVIDYGGGYAMKDFDHKTADLAIEWINDSVKKDSPFFLYLNFQATHQPYVYPEEYGYYQPDEIIDLKLFTLGGEAVTNRYDNAMRYVDAQVGRIVDTLETQGIRNNTVILIVSDHGHDLDNRHNVNEHGKSIYSEELIAPVAFYLPGVEPQLISERVGYIDILPTLIDILGYEIPLEFQGDIMVKGRPLYFVTQSHKYIIGGLFNGTKTILDINRELVEIYDIDNDPAELNDLYTKRSYTNDILRILFWSHCQKDYHSKERWEGDLNNRCAINNNFKI